MKGGEIILSDPNLQTGILFRDGAPGLQNDAAGLEIGQEVILGKADFAQKLKVLIHIGGGQHSKLIILQGDLPGSGGDGKRRIGQGGSAEGQQQRKEKQGKKLTQRGHRPFRKK